MPLIIRAPWLPASVGARSDTLVELTDLLPTMASLAGVSLPPEQTFDGQDLSPVLRGDGAAAAALRPFALSVYPRCPADTANTSAMYMHNDCTFVERSAFFAMGVSLRTSLWRYTEWLPWNATSLSPRFDAPPIGVELYNHSGDDGSTFDGDFEWVNLASDPALGGVAAELAAQLRVAYAR